MRTCWREKNRDNKKRKVKKKNEITDRKKEEAKKRSFYFPAPIAYTQKTESFKYKLNLIWPFTKLVHFE